MTFDSGILWLCSVENTAELGAMPAMKAVKKSQHFFGDRTVGFSRQYAARGVNEQIDRLARIWLERSAQTGMIALIDDEQYRVDNVQHLLDDDGLQVTDLTLRRLDTLYELAE